MVIVLYRCLTTLPYQVRKFPLEEDIYGTAL
jgi:hypothetical protein